MDFSQIDPVTLASVTFAVVGFVQLAISLIDRNWRAAVIIAVSAISGAIFGSQIGNISWFTGMLIGLNASGLITTATRVGGNK